MGHDRIEPSDVMYGLVDLAARVARLETELAATLVLLAECEMRHAARRRKERDQCDS